MSEKYKIGNPQIPHFITITVVKWLPIFNDDKLSDKILESFRYCQINKGLIIHAWCIMPSHLHAIFSCEKDHLLSSIIRDFKKFTSISITRYLLKTGDKKGHLKVFYAFGKSSSKHQYYKVWKEGYHPVELSTNSMMDQRLEYLHNNPVKAGIVESPEHFKYSSALDYYTDEDGPIQIEFIC